MDPIDEYLIKLSDTARRFVERNATAMDIMRRDAKTTAVPELVDLRVLFLAPQDRARVEGLLATGCFGEMLGDERVAAFVVCFELDDEINKLDVRRRFQRYDIEQPLFKQCPNLWPDVRDDELVSMRNVRHLGRSGLVELPGGWGRLDAFLTPELLRWVQAEFLNVPTYVRLDPWFAEREQPPEPLREAAVRPARAGWWATLALRNREGDGGHYVLQDSVQPSPSTRDEYWEYHVRGVRSLEVHARRDSSGNLSMMLEEVAADRSSSGALIGRCVHLDTDARPGTEQHAAPLNHLDLAINVYFDDAAIRRTRTRLSDGRVEDASVRTHLLRVEGVPFAAIAEFARQFFSSSVLLREWMQDQFGSAGGVSA